MDSGRFAGICLSIGRIGLQDKKGLRPRPDLWTSVVLFLLPFLQKSRMSRKNFPIKVSLRSVFRIGRMAPSWVYCQKICADNRCREEAAVLVPVSELRRLQIAWRSTRSKMVTGASVES